MKVIGFGAWPSRNVSTGGQRPLSDPFNKSFKGDPFNTEYKKEFSPRTEYSSYGMDEYHHYPAQKDLTTEQDNQTNSKENRRRNQKPKNSASRRKRLVQQAICIVAGSVVLVTSYNASVARSNAQPKENPTPPAAVDPSGPDNHSSDDSKGYFAGWRWNDDNTQATCVVTDLTGKVVGEIPATVTVSETPATCNTDGSITRTANAQYDGQTYTDARSETSPALGHSFDDGTEVTLSDGRTAMEFECARCHEHFTIVNSIDEE